MNLTILLPRQSQRWWEYRIFCDDCANNYRLLKQGNSVVPVRIEDVTSRETARDEWHRGTRDLLRRDDVKEVLNGLVARLDRCSTKAAAYRLLQGAGFYLGSQSTFTRKYKGASDWVSNAVGIPDHVESALSAVNSTNPAIMAEIQRLEELIRYADSPCEVVGEPLVRAT